MNADFIRNTGRDGIKFERCVIIRHYFASIFGGIGFQHDRCTGNQIAVHILNCSANRGCTRSKRRGGGAGGCCRVHRGGARLACS